jgi:hypothetical protein
MLPIPNAEEVKKFKELYLREFGVELMGEQALEVSMCVLQLFYLKNYPMPPEIHRKRRGR